MKSPQESLKRPMLMF
uniref:Uncharacterized protein n=1 Tax=Anguilla anguilla TaxID=7936 RepID=A0A0E9XA03_ANGAN